MGDSLVPSPIVAFLIDPYTQIIKRLEIPKSGDPIKRVAEHIGCVEKDCDALALEDNLHHVWVDCSPEGFAQDRAFYLEGLGQSKGEVFIGRGIITIVDPGENLNLRSCEFTGELLARSVRFLSSEPPVLPGRALMH
jgi:hypothetical protein